MKQTAEERKRQFYNNRDFSNPYSIMDRTSRQKINKEMDLNNSINQIHQTENRTLCPIAAEYTSFSNAHEIFFRTMC